VRWLGANGVLDDATRWLIIIVVLMAAGGLAVVVQEPKDHVVHADATVWAAAQQRPPANRLG
jgi:hypothetical protein